MHSFTKQITKTKKYSKSETDVVSFAREAVMEVLILVLFTLIH